MQIRPVTQTTPSPVPTAAQAAADPSLIAPAPSARPCRAIGAVVGAGLLGSLLAPVAAAAQEPDAPAAPAPAASAVPDPADAEAAARAEAAREAVATVVAPILQKALDEEGRGAFGCVAIDPPAVLSEAEALNLIQQEFAKAGVKLRRNLKISGFTRTVPDKAQPPLENKDDPWSAQYPAKTVRENWTFDFATEDGSMTLEFLSLEDGERESFDAIVSTAFDYDLAEIAQRLRSDFATRTNGTSITVGLFFDPLASTSIWDEEHHQFVPRPGSAFAALSEEEREAVQYDWSKRYELLHRDSLELLREQVRHFLDWARAEGRLPSHSFSPTTND